MFSKVIERLKNEPVLVVTGLSLGLTAFQDAMAGGVDGDTALLMAIQAVLGWVGRELVVPLRKTVKSDAGYAVLESPPDAVWDEPDEPLGE